MDRDTIMILIAIIGCFVGIGGFVVGMTTRAKQDGQLLAKIGFCVDGIAEIKKDVAILSSAHSEVAKDTATQEHRLTTLEREMANLKNHVYNKS